MLRIELQMDQNLHERSQLGAGGQINHGMALCVPTPRRRVEAALAIAKVL